MSVSPPSIVRLADAPDLFDVAANRIWKAWWERKGQMQEQVALNLRKALQEAPFCDGFAAQREGLYLGSVLVIASDMEERPEIGPWLAALWVEPSERSHGVGASLVAHAAAQTKRHGLKTLFLCATETNSSYYEKRGWRLREEKVGPHRLNILQLDLTTI